MNSFFLVRQHGSADLYYFFFFIGVYSEDWQNHNLILVLCSGKSVASCNKFVNGVLQIKVAFWDFLFLVLEPI